MEIIASVKVVNNIAIGKGSQRSKYKKEEIAKAKIPSALDKFNRRMEKFKTKTQKPPQPGDE